MNQLIAAGELHTGTEVHAPGWLLVEGSRVSALGAGVPPRAPDLDLGKDLVAPGFVDAHVHGGGGASFDTGIAEDAAQVVRAHQAHGTTTMMASLVTDEPRSLLHTLRELSGLVDDGLLAGVHLEGPWLSPQHAGAHDPALLEQPTERKVETLAEAGNGHLRMVTIAPELPGGLTAVRRLADRGIVVAIGHTHATYDVTREAMDAGATAGTHLFNAMRPLHHREPGPAGALLDCPESYVELIADGVHVHPAMLRLAVGRKPGLVVLVTDAMAAAGAEDGDYTLGTREVEVRGGIARLAGTQVIAGSTLTMAGAVRHAVKSGFHRDVAIRAATSHPAAMLGLSDAGLLAPGRTADLVVLDEGLGVRRVLRRGVWL